MNRSIGLVVSRNLCSETGYYNSGEAFEYAYPRSSLQKFGEDYDAQQGVEIGFRIALNCCGKHGSSDLRKSLSFRVLGSIINPKMAGKEGFNSNLVFDELNRWNSYLKAENINISQALREAAEPQLSTAGESAASADTTPVETVPSRRPRPRGMS